MSILSPHVSRRDLLRASLAAGAFAAYPGIGRLAFAAGSEQPRILVIVHLRGGCDGLNLLSPASDPQFIAARASELRVATGGADSGHKIDNGPDAGIDFRLHSAAGALAEIYADKRLAFVHAVGIPDANRSHFVAADMIDHGVGNTGALNTSTSGWLARHLRAINATGLCGAVTASGAVAGEYIGAPSTLAVTDLNSGFGVPGGVQAEAVLSRLYANAGGPVGALGRATLGAIKEIDGRVPRDPQGKATPYPNAAAYDKAGDIGRGLKTIAQLIRMDVGLTAASADCGGWDTHEGQPGRFKTQVDRLSNALAAFWNDMAAYQDRLTIVTVSEFGRRLRSNKSAGTDHGRAGVMLAMGGAVQGGRCHGGWPGLETEQLEEHVDLAVKTDYRTLLGEVLAAHGGKPVGADIFPGFSSPGNLGLLAAA